MVFINGGLPCKIFWVYEQILEDWEKYPHSLLFYCFQKEIDLIFEFCLEKEILNENLLKIEEKEKNGVSQKKIVIMGLANSGVSTTCKKFSDERWVPPREERHWLPVTIDYEKHTRVLHSTEFAIYDLAGHSAFLDRFIGELARHVFGGIDSLVFIVDTIEILDISRTKYYFDQALDRVNRYSPDASVFVFLHKIDLLPKDLKEEVCQTCTEFLSKGISRTIRVYETTIFTNSSTRAVEAVYRENIPVFEEKLTVEAEEIDQEEEEDNLLALALREALKKFKRKDSLI